MDLNFKKCPLTLNTTRICASDSLETSIEVSRIGFTHMKPNAVILVNENEVFDGISATSLVHFPINASILFTDGKSLKKETLNEIQRLCPKGYKGVHVILVGSISKKVSSKLNEYGYKTHHIAGRNHYETASMVLKARPEFKNVLIISGEDYSEGIAASYWSAHHGDPILYVQRDKIPYSTLEAIKGMCDINVYIIGSTKTISKEVENYLCNLGNVKKLDRIDGETPYEIAVNFAKYKDPKSDFGWGRHYKEGHAFTFGEINHPMEIIAGVLFAHMGKHTPLLLIKKDKITKVVEKYIKLVKPMTSEDMPSPPFMHGFILGSIQIISHEDQVMIDKMLSIDHHMMEHMEHDIMEKEHMHKMMDMDSNHHMMEQMKHEMMGKDYKHEMMNMDCNHDMMEQMKHDMMDKDHKHEMMNMNCNHNMMEHMEHDMMGNDHMHKMMNMDCNHGMMEHMKHDMMDKDHKHEIMNMNCNHDMMEHMEHDMMGNDHKHEMMNMDCNHDMTEHMKHKMMEKDHMHGKDNVHHMHEQYHMMNNADCMCMPNDKDEKHEEMNCSCNQKIDRNYESNFLNSYYQRVKIEEILE